MTKQNLKVFFEKYNILLFLVAVLGTFLVWYGTVWGAGWIYDSFEYVAGARSFINGDGFMIPYGNGEFKLMTKYPPMLSIILGLLEFFHSDTLTNARYLNIVLFGVNIFLLGLILNEHTRSRLFSIIGALLFSISPVFPKIHSWIFSEPLYLFFSICVLWFLNKYFSEHKYPDFIFASISAALLFLTRYVGLSLICSICILLVFYKANIKDKFKNIIVFGFISVFPMFLWTLRGYIYSGTINDRIIAFHPFGKTNYLQAAQVILEWVLPPFIVEGKEKILLGALSLIVLFMAIFLVKKFPKGFRDSAQFPDSSKAIAILLMIYIILYGAMIIVSRTWFDADIGVSDRQFSSILFCLIILFVLFSRLLSLAIPKSRFVLAFLCIGLIFYYSYESFIQDQLFNRVGLGLSAKAWHQSHAVSELKNYSSYSIYTNSNSTLYRWTDDSGYSINDYRSARKNQTTDKIFLIIFHHVPPREANLAKLLDGLTLIEEDRLVSIYVLDSAK